VVWDFLQRYDDSWIWRRTERHDVIESSRNFAGRDECVADAALHGYTVQTKGELRPLRSTTRTRRRRKAEASTGPR
jgi:hypothetical protein